MITRYYTVQQIIKHTHTHANVCAYVFLEGSFSIVILAHRNCSRWAHCTQVLRRSSLDSSDASKLHGDGPDLLANMTPGFLTFVSKSVGKTI